MHKILVALNFQCSCGPVAPCEECASRSCFGFAAISASLYEDFDSDIDFLGESAMCEPDAERDQHIVPAPQIPSSETLEGWGIDGFDDLGRRCQRGQEGFDFIRGQWSVTHAASPVRSMASQPLTGVFSVTGPGDDGADATAPAPARYSPCWLGKAVSCGAFRGRSRPTQDQKRDQYREKSSHSE